VLHRDVWVSYPGGLATEGVDVVVDSASKFEIGIEEDHDPVAPGDEVTYTVVVGNKGTQTLPLSAQGAVAARVPAGTTFISATAGGTYANGVVSWNVSSMSAGSSQHYTFKVSVGGTLPNGTVLESTAEMLDGTTSLARAMTATEVKASSPLKLSVTANADPVAPNPGLVTYEMKLSNVGATQLSNVVLNTMGLNGVDVLYSVTGEAVCPNNCPSGAIASWTEMTLAPGQTQTVWLTVRVTTPASGAINGAVLHRDVWVSYPGGLATEGVDVVVDSASKFEIGIEEDHDPVAPGDEVTYMVTVGNKSAQASPTSAQGAVEVRMPDGMYFLSASGGGTQSGGVVRWNVGSMSANSAQKFTFTVDVEETLPDATVLEATAVMLDGTKSLARTETSTEVKAGAPLSLSVTASPEPVAPNGLVTYVATVTNLGSTPLANVVFSNMPSSMGTVSSTTGGGVCSGGCSAGELALWPGITLEPGQSTTLSTVVRASSAAPKGTVLHNKSAVTYILGDVTRGIDVVVQ
jgi:uncharacterized repeat protein (TIGR01451 family)